MASGLEAKRQYGRSYFLTNSILYFLVNRFSFRSTPIDDLVIVERAPLSDERGYFERFFCSTNFEPILGNRSIQQINHNLTGKKGVLRGMHFQHPPHAELKLVSCLRGEVFDVAVDLRRGSKTFLQWHAEVLNETNHLTLCIPEGFAHGFLTLTHDCEMIYMHTADYSPDHEAGLNALDPRLAISWPAPIAERSVRDRELAMLTPDFAGLSL